MPADPWKVVLARLHSEPASFFEDEVRSWPPPWFVTWRQGGLLSEGTPSRTGMCPDCGYRDRVGFIENVRGELQPYLSCRTCGPVRLDPQTLRRWQVHLPTLARELTRALGLTAAYSALQAGHLWLLGRYAANGRSVPVLFGRHVSGEIAVPIHQAAGRQPNSLLLLPTEREVAAWGTATPNPALALETITRWEPAGLWADPLALAAALPSEPGKGRTKRPRPRKRSERSGNIDRLMQELRDHLRTARDHAVATLDRNGTPQLLPRPTQRFLAKQLGVKSHTISRCLSDPTARELQIMWHAANDLDAVLRWKS